jgi:hypothetical protein
MTIRGGQSWTQGVELVVEPLLGLLPVRDQPTPVTARGAQLLDHRLLRLAPAGTLPGQVGQRGTVTIVSLETPRPQLRASGRVSEGANTLKAPG